MNSRIVVWVLATLSVLLVVVPLLGMLGMLGIGGTILPSSMAGGISGTVLAVLWMLLMAVVIGALIVIAARGARRT
jgi:hypothetical protein